MITLSDGSVTIDKQQAALEPCPFCGARVRLNQYTKDSIVHPANGCALSLRDITTTRWNRRTPSPQAETYEDGIRKGLKMALVALENHFGDVSQVGLIRVIRALIKKETKA